MSLCSQNENTDVGINPTLSSGSVCDGDRPHRPVFLHEGLPLPVPSISLRHWFVWADIPGSFPQLLLPCLHQGQEVAQSPSERSMLPDPCHQED